MVTAATAAMRTMAPRGSRRRFTPFATLSPIVGPCVTTFVPWSQRATSSASSAAVWKRFAGSFSSDLSAIAESPSGQLGSTFEGGSGSCVRIRPIVP